MAAIKVSYAQGSYEVYIASGSYVPGRIYYLTEENGTPHIFLNGKEYTENKMEWQSLPVEQGE